jgi:hypothetical protein
LWTREYKGKDKSCSCIQKTNDKGYIIIGDSSGRAAYILKIDSIGNIMWGKAYTCSTFVWGHWGQQTNDGGYIITATRDGNPSIWLIKTNSSGDTVWTKFYSGNYECGSIVQQTYDYGYIVGGTSISPRGEFLVKTDSLGNTDWIKTYPYPTAYPYKQLSFVQQTKDSGYIITGETNDSNYNNWDAYLIKTNKLGDTLWTRVYDNTDWDKSYYVEQTSDGGYVMTGRIIDDNDNLWLLKTNSSGDIVWDRKYHKNSANAGYCVHQTKDGGYIVVGSTGIFDKSDLPIDVYLLKTDSLGNVGIEESQNWSETTSRLGGPKLTISQNPFSHSTIITYRLSELTTDHRPLTTLCIYDLSGKLVKNLLPNSTCSVTLSANNLKTGIYFLTLSTGTSKTTKKLILMK